MVCMPLIVDRISSNQRERWQRAWSGCREEPWLGGHPMTEQSSGRRHGGSRAGFAFCNFCFVAPGPRTRSPDLNRGPVTRHLSHATRHLVHLAGECHLASGTQHPAPSPQPSALSPQPSTPLTPSRNPPAAGTVRSGESRCRRVQRHRGWRSPVRRGADSH